MDQGAMVKFIDSDTAEGFLKYEALKLAPSSGGSASLSPKPMMQTTSKHNTPNGGTPVIPRIANLPSPHGADGGSQQEQVVVAAPSVEIEKDLFDRSSPQQPPAMAKANDTHVEANLFERSSPQPPPGIAKANDTHVEASAGWLRSRSAYGCSSMGLSSAAKGLGSSPAGSEDLVEHVQQLKVMLNLRDAKVTALEEELRASRAAAAAARAAEQEARAKIEALGKLEKSLDRREEALEKREDTLGLQWRSIEKREAELTSREKAVEAEKQQLHHGREQHISQQLSEQLSQLRLLERHIEDSASRADHGGKGGGGAEAVAVAAQQQQQLPRSLQAVGGALALGGKQDAQDRQGRRQADPLDNVPALVESYQMSGGDMPLGMVVAEVEAMQQAATRLRNSVGNCEEQLEQLEKRRGTKGLPEWRREQLEGTIKRLIAEKRHFENVAESIEQRFEPTRNWGIQRFVPMLLKTVDKFDFEFESSLITRQLSETSKYNGEHKYAVGAKVVHVERGPGEVIELMEDGRTRVKFDSGEEHRYKPTSMHKLRGSNETWYPTTGERGLELVHSLAVEVTTKGRAIRQPIPSSYPVEHLQTLMRLYEIALTAYPKLLETVNDAVDALHRSNETDGNGVRLGRAEVVKSPKPTKGLKRALQKAQEEYDGQYTRILDFVRVSIVADTLNGLVFLMRWLMYDRSCTSRMSVVRIKDRLSRSYDSEMSGGNRDVMLNGVLDLGGGRKFVVEIQLHLRVLYQLKADLHVLYAGARVLGAMDDATSRHEGRLTDKVIDKARLGVLRKLLCPFTPMSDSQLQGVRDLLTYEPCPVLDLDLDEAFWVKESEDDKKGSLSARSRGAGSARAQLREMQKTLEDYGVPSGATLHVHERSGAGGGDKERAAAAEDDDDLMIKPMRASECDSYFVKLEGALQLRGLSQAEQANVIRQSERVPMVLPKRETIEQVLTRLGKVVGRPRDELELSCPAVAEAAHELSNADGSGKAGSGGGAAAKRIPAFDGWQLVDLLVRAPSMTKASDARAAIREEDKGKPIMIVDGQLQIGSTGGDRQQQMMGREVLWGGKAQGDLPKAMQGVIAEVDPDHRGRVTVRIEGAPAATGSAAGGSAAPPPVANRSSSSDAATAEAEEGGAGENEDEDGDKVVTFPNPLRLNDELASDLVVAARRLRRLNLGSCGLLGQLPVALSKCSALVQLILNSNKLRGPLPPWLGQLTYLEGLFLDRNEFTGTVPPELKDCKNLERLMLQENKLEGEVPAVALSHCRNLLMVRLEANDRHLLKTHSRDDPMKGPLRITREGEALLKALPRSPAIISTRREQREQEQKEKEEKEKEKEEKEKAEKEKEAAADGDAL